MKEPKTLRFVDLPDYEDAWSDCLGDIDWKYGVGHKILKALATDYTEAGKLLFWYLEKTRVNLEEEINMEDE